MTTHSSAGPAALLRQQLRTQLVTALKTRDQAAIAVLRSTLAAIDNAEATDTTASHTASTIEDSPAGAGATEAERRVLTPAHVDAIVRAEITERESAAHDYDQAGHHERAERLRAEAAVLRNIWREH